ncbi:3,4-dihydroxy-2-butanone-4-phosphate synthase [Saccharopolyspora sp. NFXS83]|uniref:3,4-dihydroxy-2-butanone-4-phosphate synthase n=1 Tax=Saccharopolyspora sp. NFXS83 TaxID=2993560 RepID=UPI00224B3204|nr:3,4-dihydroxy-2-butanone-4-phosphate synthase [Saccharopolyspora sp. NFXS83]MCX2729304.1 3,4-dihydroxy-2-butanone-4-phosphate synthase [Saccharopolyspora sp. NFXS83]
MTTIEAPARTGTAEPVPAALAELAAGRPVVVLDDREAHLVFAAAHATARLVAFAVRHTSGLLRAAISAERADELRLPPMTSADDRRGGAVHAVAVDAVAGVTTGISAADRARTITALAEPRTAPDDLARPGHVVPLRVGSHGVLAHRGPAEAAADLAALAGLSRAGAFDQLIGLDDPTLLAPAAEARAFAREHGLAVLSIDDVVAHRMRRDGVVRRCAEARLPLAAGTFRAVGYRSLLDEHEHLALVQGWPEGSSPVHVHRECALSAVPGAAHCGCRRRLDIALEDCARRGEGIVVLVRGDMTSGTCPATDPRGQHLADLLAEAITTDLRSSDRPTSAGRTGVYARGHA